jgi:hypothetical protein
MTLLLSLMGCIRWTGWGANAAFCHEPISFSALAFIGPDFTMEHKVPFDQAYMRALFDYGYRLGRTGYRWRKAPPILETPAQS